MVDVLKQNYINYLNTGKNNIFRADFHIIGGCNFKCIMCDNWKKPVEKNFSKEDIFKNILKLKKDYNCNYIRFHGQEPTLFPDLELIIAFCKKLKIKTAIKSNAWLLTDTKITKLIKSGLDEIYLSIDGPESIIHDYIRRMDGSFNKNIGVIKFARKLKKDIKIYINSVVMNLNLKELNKMLDLGYKYKLDGVSFVFLNTKNTKDISNINIKEKDFINFFKIKIPEILDKAIQYDIKIDFSPFISDLVFLDKEKILYELRNNFDKYLGEIKAFSKGIYGKYFYDKYGCFGPIDHCSINYNGDMYGCCVVERERSNSVGNIISSDLSKLWEEQKYIEYRNNSNEKCNYSQFCASNFYTRKALFKSIYLNKDLFDINKEPIKYYRYLKEVYNEDNNIIEKLQIKKLKELLLNLFKSNIFYRDLLTKNKIKLVDILKISDLSILKKIPIIDKNIIEKNYYKIIDKIDIMSSDIDEGKTSGSSGQRFSYYFQRNYKRYIKQIAIFSRQYSFIFNDSYFSITPRNCNFKSLGDEPEYVKKQYVPLPNNFDFNDKDYFIKVNSFFKKHNDIKYIYGDSRHIFFLILGFQKYLLKFPDFLGVTLSYSYTNRSLKAFIKNYLKTEVYDSYGCSEIGPIALEINGKLRILDESVILEVVNQEIITTDLDNHIFPFVRYKIGDIGSIQNNNLDIFGRNDQIINGKNLKNIDNFMYKNFPSIIFYQFNNNDFIYYSIGNLDGMKIKKYLKSFLGKEYNIKKMDSSFFIVGGCSKFKFIN